MMLAPIMCDRQDLPRDPSMLVRAARIFDLAWWVVVTTIPLNSLEDPLSCSLKLEVT